MGRLGDDISMLTLMSVSLIPHKNLSEEETHLLQQFTHQTLVKELSRFTDSWII
jgi:hypothetical protein